LSGEWETKGMSIGPPRWVRQNGCLSSYCAIYFIGIMYNLFLIWTEMSDYEPLVKQNINCLIAIDNMKYFLKLFLMMFYITIFHKCFYCNYWINWVLMVDTRITASNRRQNWKIKQISLITKN
jgi:hypothetical protein